MSIMQKYSDIYCIPMHEIKEWVNNYALGKVPDNMIIEDTKEERIESIKSYIQSQVDDSITGRIKGNICNTRIENAKVKEVHECPF